MTEYITNGGFVNGEYTDTISASSGSISASSSIAWCSSQICRYCNGAHTVKQCPRVKEIRYRKDGSIKWVEFHEVQPQPVYIYPPWYYYPTWEAPYYPTWVAPVNPPTWTGPYEYETTSGTSNYG